MTHQKDILTELKDFPILSSISRQTPYNAPNGYFESLLLAVNQHVNIKKEKKNPFSEPTASYFDSLTSIVLNKAKESEEIRLTVSTENPYQIPANYFNTLPATVLRRVQKPAKVISIQKKLYRWVGAAAACIVLLIGLQWLGTNNTDQTEISISSLSDVPTEEIVAFASLQGYDTTEESFPYSFIQEDNTLEDFDLDLDVFLEDYSLEEIQQYLNNI